MTTKTSAGPHRTLTRVGLVTTSMLFFATGCASAAPRPSAAPTAPRAMGATPSPLVTQPMSTPTPTAAASSMVLLGLMPSTKLDPASSAKLDQALAGLVRDGAPDAIAAVITANGAWAGAAGIDGPKRRAARIDDEFGIASVSKMFLAALILRLAEQEKLDLDGPLETYLGGIDIDANGATIRQALAMRSGIGAAPDAVLERALAECSRPWSKADVLATVPPPFTTAGSRFLYSNPTYKLLGYAAEQVTGQSLATAIQDLVIDPVGEDRILLQGPERRTPKPWALPIAGYGDALEIEKYGTGGTLPCLGFSTLAQGASAVASDAPSLARWGWALFSGRIVDADSLAAMTTVDADGHGLGIDRFYDFGRTPAFGHAGSQPGYAALLTILPTRKVVVVLFINDANADVFVRARTLIDAITD